MVTTKSTSERISWSAAVHGVCGASHQKRGLPMQDAHGVWRDDSMNALCVAVADGHGHRVHCRSQLGAVFAVTSILDTAAQLAQILSAPSISVERNLIRQLATQGLIQHWRHQVREHQGREPFTDSESQPHELASLMECARDHLPSNPFVAYGTTLIAALLVLQP
jgi:serine/threonine protein phosphatase PrpC